MQKYYINLTISTKKLLFSILSQLYHKKNAEMLAGIEK